MLVSTVLFVVVMSMVGSVGYLLNKLPSRGYAGKSKLLFRFSAAAFMAGLYNFCAWAIIHDQAVTPRGLFSCYKGLGDQTYQLAMYVPSILMVTAVILAVTAFSYRLIGAWKKRDLIEAYRQAIREEYEEAAPEVLRREDALNFTTRGDYE